MSPISCDLILAADFAWIDNQGKLGMVGIFDCLRPIEYPTLVSSVSFFLQLRDVPKGKHQLVGKVCFFDEATPLMFGLDFEIQNDVPKLQLQIPSGPFHIPKEGEYRVKFSIDGQEVGVCVLAALPAGGGEK